MIYANHINYLTSLGHGHPHIETVIHGDYEQIFELESTDIDYPLFWVETPDLSMGGDGDRLTQTFNNSFVIGVNVTPGDKTAEMRAKDVTHSYMMQTIRKMLEDRDEGRIVYFDARNIKIDPIYIGSDGIVGWRAEVPIIIDVCEDVAEYESVYHPSFTYTDGIVEEDIDPNVIGYTRQWVIYHDGDTTISTDNTLDLSVIDSDMIYVELVYEGRNHSMVSSMTVTDGTEYSSEPYANNPFI